MLDAKLAGDRRAIFINVANGVPMDRVRAAFGRSQTEIDREVRFVGRKLREARVRTRMPPLACDDVRDIRWNRRALLDTLRQLSDDFLSTELSLPNIGVHKIDTPDNLHEAARQAGLKTGGAR